MPMFIDTRGRSKIAVAICARCSGKFPYDELSFDPNEPGLFVCKDDLDEFDPWRLPARATENITLAHPRPDVVLTVGPQFVPVGELEAVIGGFTTQTGQSIAAANAIAQINPSQPWHANAAYALGATVTPSAAVGFAAGGTIISVFLCIIPGMSGVTPPTWTTTFGTEVFDGQVMWFNTGLYLP